MFYLSDSIEILKGVGAKKGLQLNKLGIFNVEDLLYHYPRDYEDRKTKSIVSDLKIGQKICFDAKVLELQKDYRPKRNFVITKVKLFDGKNTIFAVWYNNPYIKSSICEGQEYCFYGKIEKSFNQFSVLTPVFEPLGSVESINVGSIVPIYPLTEGINDIFLRKLIFQVTKNQEGMLEEFLPEDIKKEFGLCDINFAMKNIHSPESFEALNIARRRLVFDEFLTVLLSLRVIKQGVEKMAGFLFKPNDEFQKVFSKLPFTLTNAQERVVNELIEDMTSGFSMNRLLQGDVGSGKTIVAAIILYLCVKNGYQGVMMAPTEIVASQHYELLKNLFDDLNVELLTGSTKQKDKNNIIKGLIEGNINIVVGTHALLEDKVEFKNIGLVITDEQHRFGVRQRAKLVAKGNNPHVLVMSATPIPRTLSLVLYGDMDISIIDELPPNRKEIQTFYFNSAYMDRMLKFVKKEIDLGRQIYYVCPLVEDSENLSAKSVNYIYEKIKSHFEGYKLEILHGKMKPKEKDQIMNAFRDGEINILISTTVIEVGVNVPNSSIMIIQNAERFGLAQLHQLRGRVGRGQYQSYCFLICDSGDELSLSRMKVMASTNDGFKIAEKDLELRGTGDMFGIKQHGLIDFKIANLFADKEELAEALKCTKQILNNSSLDKNQNYNKLKIKILDYIAQNAKTM